MLLFPAPALADLWRHPGHEQAVRTYGVDAMRWRDAEVLGSLIRRAAAPGDRMFAVGSDPNHYWQAVSGRPPQPCTGCRSSGGALAPSATFCPRPSRFLVRQLGSPPPEEPRCLTQAPYVEVARHGISVLLELRER